MISCIFGPISEVLFGEKILLMTLLKIRDSSLESLINWVMILGPGMLFVVVPNHLSGENDYPNVRGKFLPETNITSKASENGYLVTNSKKHLKIDSWKLT